MIRNKERLQGTIIVLLGIACALVAAYVYYDNLQLEKNKVYTKAIIHGRYFYRLKENIKYRYIVDDIVYEGFGTNIRDLDFSIGDTCLVKYSKIKPEVSKLARNKDKSAIIIRANPALD